MTIFYGVKANAAATGNSVDTYMTAAQLNGTPALWSNVISVQVALTFTNPLYARESGEAAADRQHSTCHRAS